MTELLHPTTSPLRIAQVMGMFEGGGAQRQAYNLVVGLHALGCDSKGIALRRVGDFVTWGDHPDLFSSLGAEREHRASVLRAAWRWRRLVSRWRPHAIHVQGADSLPFVHFAMRGLRWKPCVYFTWQDSGSVLGPPGRARARMVRALQGCEGVFGSSVDVARRLGEGAGLADVGVFYGGVPEVPASSPLPPPLVLWVGRMEPAKDPERLVRALAILKDQGIPCRAALVGGGNAGSGWFDEFRSRLRQEGLSDVAEFPGYVDDLVLSDYYREAAICVQTSLTEGMSQGLLEQMMRGIAVVATDVGDTRVALDGGKCGVLIPRDSPAEALAGELASLLRSPERRRQLGDAARARARTEFSIEAMVRRARAIYERGRVRHQRPGVADPE